MIIFIIFCFVIFLWAWQNKYNSKIEPPVFPGYLPFIGHANVIKGSSSQFWDSLKFISTKCLEAGGVVSFWIGPIKTYVLADPEDFLTVANACVKKSKYYDFFKSWLGQGLVTGNDKWKVHRKLLNSSFHQNVLYSFLDVFNKQARRLVKDLENKAGVGQIDIFPYICQNGLETICLTSMGVDFTDKKLQNNEYIDALAKVLNTTVHRIQRFWLHPDFIYNFSSLKKIEDRNVKILRDFSNMVLKERKKKYLSEKNLNFKDASFKPFIDRLLELSIESNAFNDDEIGEHVHTMIAAGHDTVANTVIFAILLVGSHPDVQEKIFLELQMVFGDKNEDVTKQDLSKLIYLEAVLKETLRCYPTVPILSRKIHENVKLRNCTLVKGTTCMLNVYGAHRHPMWGPDAEKFKPERWLDRATLPNCSSAFVGFSTGKRNCIGISYAYMTMKTILCHIFRNFEVKSDISKLKVKMEIQLKTASGHHITLEKRKI